MFYVPISVSTIAHREWNKLLLIGTTNFAFEKKR